MRLTIKRINKELENRGHKGIELVKGEGYFWFTGGETASFRSSSVYVFRLSHLTLDEWVQEYENMLEEHINSR